MSPMTNVVKPTFPDGTAATDLDFESLIETMVGDLAYVGKGTLSDADITTYLSDQETIATTLAANFVSMGELTEKPAKANSNVQELKTRNYSIAGKRDSTIELMLAGLGNLQKDYLESAAFGSETMTIIMRNREGDRMVIFNGMRWIVTWSGEVDSVFQFVLKTSFSGASAGKILVYKDIPADSGT